MSDKEKPVKETGKAKRAGKPSNGLVKTNKERWDSKPSSLAASDGVSEVPVLNILFSEEGAFAALCEDTFGWHNDRIDHITQPRISPTSVYEVMRYDSDLFSTASGTRVIMTDIARLLEDAMLLCLAFDRAQDDVLIAESGCSVSLPFADTVITRNPEGLGGFQAVASHAGEILRGICQTHYCNSTKIETSCVHPDSTFESSMNGVHHYLVALCRVVLTALRVRISLLFRAGVASPIQAVNSVDLLNSITSDILTLTCDPNEAKTVGVVESNKLLGLVAASLRIHNATTASTILDITNGTHSDITTAFPVLLNNWMVKHGK